MNQIKKIERFLDKEIRGMTPKTGEELILIINRLMPPIFPHKRLINIETY